jgi:hypothetical protein
MNMVIYDENPFHRSEFLRNFAAPLLLSVIVCRRSPDLVVNLFICTVQTD